MEVAQRFCHVAGCRHPNSHITQHHQDGTCLGVVDFLPLNHIYTLLMKTHGMLYRDNYVTTGTFLHDVVNVVMDYVLFLLSFLTFFTVLKATTMCSNIFSSSFNTSKKQRVEYAEKKKVH